jgi:hypothetical protein
VLKTATLALRRLIFTFAFGDDYHLIGRQRALLL